MCEICLPRISSCRKYQVKGEVSNCKYHTSGHIYFSLKDETGTLSLCDVCRTRGEGWLSRMKDGDQVDRGAVLLMCMSGTARYQLYAREITLEGAGASVSNAIWLLKQELEEMGMFAQEYKQPIPRFIKRLGVVTAPTGAAVQDIRNISLQAKSISADRLVPGSCAGRRSCGEYCERNPDAGCCRGWM